MWHFCSALTLRAKCQPVLFPTACATVDRQFPEETANYFALFTYKTLPNRNHRMFLVMRSHLADVLFRQSCSAFFQRTTLRIFKLSRHAFCAFPPFVLKKVTGQCADLCSYFIPSTMSWPITVGWTESRRRCTGTRMLPGRFPRSTTWTTDRRCTPASTTELMLPIRTLCPPAWALLSTTF